ncbi:MAG: hypothetical protein U0325_22330 [Polyangiales bacterium]
MIRRAFWISAKRKGTSVNERMPAVVAVIRTVWPFTCSVLPRASPSIWSLRRSTWSTAAFIGPWRSCGRP